MAGSRASERMRFMKINVIKAAIAALSAGIIIVLALLTGEIVAYRYAGASGAGKKDSPLSHPLAAPSPKEFSRYAQIAKSGLFGDSAIQFVDVSGSGEAQAASDVELAGTVVGSPKMSYALFRDKVSKRVEAFRKGDDVFGVGVLVAVEKDRALLDAGGATLVFTLPEARLDGSADYSSAASLRPPPSADAKGAKPAILSRKTGESEWIIDAKALNSVLNDMGKILTDARLLPYSEKGKVTGFTISEMRPGGVFNLIGLQNGDILLKINDLAIDSPEKGVQLLAGLRGESRLTLDVLRGGQHRKLNYHIR